MLRRTWLAVTWLGLALCVGTWAAGSAVALETAPVAMAVGDSTKLFLARVTSAKVWAAGAPAAWRDRAFDDRAWPSAQGLVVPQAALSPGAASVPGVTGVEFSPGASLHMRTHFDVANPELARVIELRVTYQDGFVASLNGVEIARRNLPVFPPNARPPVSHGADPERIFIPLDARGPTISKTDNLLVVEIRPAVGRMLVDANAPAGEATLAFASGVRLVRGPYLIAPADGAVSVAWETNLPARGDVQFQPDGADAQPSRRALGGKLDIRHVVRLTGLAPGRRYRYHVEVEGPQAGDRVASMPASFETAPTREQPMRFVVYGDMRAPGHAAHAQVVAGILRERPALTISPGDLVAVGSEESAWQRYFEITAPLGAISSVIAALGNHDKAIAGAGAAKTWELFGLPFAGPTPGYTSFDWGGVHFVILDTNQLDRTQRDWLTRDLAAARKRRPRAIFAVCHDGPWSHGVHGGSRTMERDFAPVMASGGVDVVFGGHDHLYERGVGATPGGPLPYIVAGGGGAPLYNLTCQTPAAPGTIDASAAPSGSGAWPLRACPSSVAMIRKAYHYVVVEIAGRTLRLCPRLPDGSPIEPCAEMPLRAGSSREN